MFSDKEARSDVEVFWGEIAPSEHMVEFFENDCSFLSSLASYVRHGMQAGDAVVIVAIPPRRKALECQLESEGISLTVARSRDQYIAVDAEETLRKFMVNGWPDDTLFEKTVGELIARARRPGRKVRVFGEMVALLWGEGHHGATVRLEHLWHGFCDREAFPLFCAYPKSGFTKAPLDSMREICSAHSRVIGPGLEV